MSEAKARNENLIKQARADLTAGATGPDVAEMIRRKDAFEAKERKRLMRIIGNRNCNAGQEDFPDYDTDDSGIWIKGEFVRGKHD